MIIDSHCHFHLLEEPESADAALAEARAAGVDYFLNVAVDAESHDALTGFSERHARVFTSAGVHPFGTGDDPSVYALVALAQHPRVISLCDPALAYRACLGDHGWQPTRL